MQLLLSQRVFGEKSLMQKMMRRLLMILLCWIATHMLWAQSDYDVVREEIPTTAFTRLVAGGFFDIEVRIGKEYKAVLEVTRRWRQHVLIELVGDQLTVGLKKGKINMSMGRREIRRLYLTVPTLENITLLGATDLVVGDEDTLRATQLIISTQGASNLRARIDVTQLQVICQGASDLRLRGCADTAEINSQGASDVHATELRVKRAYIIAQGASNVSIRCEGEMEVRAKGASDVTNYGRGRIVNATGGGASDIRSKD